MDEWMAEVTRLAGHFGPEEQKYLERLHSWDYPSEEAAKQLARKRDCDGKEEVPE